MYASFFKRFLDFIIALVALIVLFPLLLVLTICGAIVMKGNPFFVQPRPGKGEKIFKLIKFRSMTNEKDADGKLLPDEARLTPYGQWLRDSSMDELPELLNIIVGDMSIVGPRPLLVRDMVFMTAEQRRRHTVRQGLTGLAQVNGRNHTTWEKKLEYDLKYIEKITFWGDLKILFQTVSLVLSRKGVSEEGCATAEDLADYLIQKGLITEEQYDQGQSEALELLRR